MKSRTYGVGFYAPAGYTLSPGAIERAAARFEARGHRVVIDPTCHARWQRFAAPDDERLAAVMRMANDPAVDVAIAVRGGFGWSRLLDRLDFAAIAAQPTRWLGHSDYTAFALAALAHAHMITFAGPMVAYDFGCETPSDFTLAHCEAVLENDEHTVQCALDGPDIDCETTLWGGNLAMVAHLVGTPHFPEVDDGVLFLEDIGEHPYRIERMLYQLHFAGVLARQKAVLLGVFNGYEAMPNDNGYDFATMVAHARERFGVPFHTGLPFGHCPEKLTLPVGGKCALRVQAGKAELRLFDYANEARR